MKHTIGLAAAVLFAGVTSALPAKACASVSGGGGIVFGTYLGLVMNSSGSGQVNCINGVHYEITANQGLSVGATVTKRKMRRGGGVETLSYSLTRDLPHTQNWGNTRDVDSIPGTGNGAARAFSFFATLPAGQTLTPGTYTDTVAIQVTPVTGSIRSGSVSVAATIVAACTVSATNLNFGTYTGALTSLTSTVTANCTNTTAYNIGFNAGTAVGATVTTRKMTGPGGLTLGYSLFRNSPRTLNWGNTVGTNTLSGTGNGSAQVITVYGRISAGAVPNPGAFSDTITATLTY